jgi:transcriptional regulator with XRE-family HTH domain
MLGVPQNSLSNYERGQAAPTLDLLVRLKAYSSKSIDWIVTGDDEGIGTQRKA